MTTLTHPQAAEAGRLRTLCRWNAGLSVLHLIQPLGILALASSFSLPVTGSFLRMNTATNRLIAVPDELVRVRIVPLVAAFLLISAIAPALASARPQAWYERSLTRGIQPARWIEYSMSSSLMMVVIAMLVGIYDIAGLILIFALNATMTVWLDHAAAQPDHNAHQLNRLLVRVLRRDRPVDRGGDLPHRRRQASRVRLRDLRLDLRLLQRLRRQHGPAVPPRWPLA